MDSKDIKPIEALAAAAIKHQAELKAYHKVIVELMMKVTGSSFDACETALTEAARIEHQKLLEGIELESPALAALLDQRGPEHLPESD